MDVAVIGGGIGGLTAAIALQQRGIVAHVYEGAASLETVGAGIWVPSNALQVLARLGLAGAIHAAGAALRQAALHDYQHGPLQAVDLQAVARRYGYGTVALHRARLQAALVAQLAPGTVHCGKRCQRVSQDAHGVQVDFGDGSTIHAPLLIAADGVRSVVRRQLFPAAPLRYAEQSAYRAVVRFALPPQWDGMGTEIWAPGCRFGFSSIGHGAVYWYATFDAPAGSSETPAEAKVRLASLFAAFPAPVPALLAASEDPLVRTDLYDLPRLPRWHTGRVALLGDAAHATTPNLGQGGAQAIEDGYVLAEQLARQPHAAAFAAYQRLRQPKATMVVNRSWQMGKLAHLSNPLGRAARNLLMRGMPAALGQRQFAALFALPY